MGNTLGVHDARPATTDDVPALAAVLAGAFFDDPVMAWVFADAGRRAIQLRAFFALLLEEVFVPLAASDTVGEACALWTPPGTPPWADDEATRTRARRIIEICGPDLPRLAVLSDTMDAHHPAESHWYLSIIGTDPAARGRGLGGALLAHGLERVDADHLPAYLESTNPRNVSLYERHGFEPTEVVELDDGGPVLTLMWRDPR